MVMVILLRIGSIICFLLAITSVLVIMMKYGTLYDRATAYNEVSDSEVAYDRCGGIYDSQNEPDGTKWTQVYKFNYVLYMVFIIHFAASLLCTCFTPAMSICICMFACSACPFLASFILTGIRLLNSVGSACADTNFVYNEDANLSFDDDADFMKKIWIAQLAMHIPIMCFAAIAF